MNKTNNSNNFVYGRKPVLEALTGRRQVKEIWLAGEQAAAMSAIIKLAGEEGITVTRVSKHELDGLTAGAVHQGVAAKVTSLRFLDIHSLIADMKERKKGLVLMLDGITDTGNFGSILRSALGYGVDAIIIPKARSAAVTPAVAKRSAGALEHLNIIKSNLAQAASLLKDNDFWLVGTDVSAKEDVWDFQWPLKAALVLGSEDRGLSSLMKQKSDFLINIPISKELESLNVAVAGGILLNEYSRYIAARP